MQVLDRFVAYATDSVDEDTLRKYLEELEGRIRSLNAESAA